MLSVLLGLKILHLYNHTLCYYRTLADVVPVVRLTSGYGRNVGISMLILPVK